MYRNAVWVKTEIVSYQPCCESSLDYGDVEKYANFFSNRSKIRGVAGRNQDKKKTVLFFFLHDLGCLFAKLVT